MAPSERWWLLIDRLIIPSCSGGVLDCFNMRISRFFKKESMCCLQGDCDNLLVLGLFSFLYKQPINEDCTYTFKIADFKKYIGFSGGGKGKDLKAELLKLSQVGYVWQYSPEENLIQVAFNETGTFATVSSTYFDNIKTIMSGAKAIRNKWGKVMIAGRSAYSSMVYTSILKERSISAVEVVIEFVKLIERRGPLEEGQTAHISVLSLAERCPTLYKQLQKKQVKEQNRILKLALEKSIELMKIHTDIFKCFEDLKFIFPEKITFSNESVINIIYSRRIF